MKAQSSVFMYAFSGAATPSLDFFRYKRQLDSETTQKRALQNLYRITVSRVRYHVEWNCVNFLSFRSRTRTELLVVK